MTILNHNPIDRARLCQYFLSDGLEIGFHKYYIWIPTSYCTKQCWCRILKWHWQGNGNTSLQESKYIVGNSYKGIAFIICGCLIKNQ